MKPFSKWRYNGKNGFGNHYKFLGCCRLKANGEPHAIYVEWEDGNDDDFHGEWWCMPLTQWNQEFTEVKE